MRYSFEKSELSDAQLRELLEKSAQIVAANAAKAQQNESNIKSLQNSPLRDPNLSIDDTGSLIVKRPGSLKRALPFFLTPQRSFLNAIGGLDLRGARYLVTLDPTLTISRKLDILLEDYKQSQSLIIKQQNDIPPSALLGLLDYSKNSIITIFNYYVANEKIGRYPSSSQYWEIRDILQSRIQELVRDFYSLLIGKQPLSVLKTPRKDFSRILGFVVSELKAAANKHDATARALARTECSHPRIMLATTFFLRTRTAYSYDFVVGMPSGGTELAALAAEMLSSEGGGKPKLLLLPISLHSAKEYNTPEEIGSQINHPLAEKIRSAPDFPRVLIVDDNSSTGRTIEVARHIVLAKAKTASVTCAVAEADLKRSMIDIQSKSRARIAGSALYEYAAGVLPVSEAIVDKWNLRELMERRKLKRYFLKLAVDHKSDITESVMAEIKAFAVATIPAVEMKSRGADELITSFSGTFLSNFSYAAVVYNGLDFTSVERAYQRAKFKLTDLNRIPASVAAEIKGHVKHRGFNVDIFDINLLFQGGIAGSSEVKKAADIMREAGLERDDWQAIRLKTMIVLLIQKFNKPDYRDLLLGTKDKYLVEGNNWDDVYWGFSGNRGENMLGAALMVLRERLRASRGNVLA